jgi:aminoglycoside phosphotransferase (APT) family kinase protein
VHMMHPGVELSSARLATNGAQYDVVIAGDHDDEWVFRFARNDASRAALQRELTLLDAIAGRMPVSVPVPELRAADAMAYRLLPGEPLTHWLLQSLEPSVQQRLAEQLGAFLQMLHRWPGELPLPANINNGGSLDDLHEHFRRTLYAYLDAHQQVWIDRLFADAASITANQPAPQSRLIHNDFKVGHVLYDARTGRLTRLTSTSATCCSALANLS